ncbi:MAG: group II intron reverse transcriptase/maturase [Verrucomicrobia bacterium]|nr:group II intron reverse transcriptase/maturase [Verrucomicrobiota bacterium]
MSKTKPYLISKQLVMEAYQHIKENKGVAGVDQQSLENFDANLKDNLYKIWNRMSSGSYFPPPVKAVPIPKKSGGERILGIPTVSDRVAQMVVKLTFEPLVEPHFLEDSYGYRPNKSALDAIGITRQRCWKYDYVVEFDIKGLFDNVDHDLLLKTVRKHTDNKWVILYVERWMKAPLQMPDGTLVERTRGLSQGGVVSPVLSNLFLHYVFDVWMEKSHPGKPWCRYADDGLVHCKTEQEAQEILVSLKQRFEMCKLELHPKKTQIVYCKDSNRKEEYPNKSFDFLGYTFRSRMSKGTGTKGVFTGFTPAVSNQAVKLMRKKTRKCGYRNRTELSIEEIAERINPILQGWLNYYGQYNRSALYSVWRHVNKTLIAWAMRKYKPLKHSKKKATILLEKIWKNKPNLFVHWRVGMKGAFA